MTLPPIGSQTAASIGMWPPPAACASSSAYLPCAHSMSLVRDSAARQPTTSDARVGEGILTRCIAPHGRTTAPALAVRTTSTNYHSIYRFRAENMIVLGPRKFWGPCVNREKRPHQRTQRAHPHQFGLAAVRVAARPDAAQGRWHRPVSSVVRAEGLEKLSLRELCDTTSMLDLERPGHMS